MQNNAVQSPEHGQSPFKLIPRLTYRVLNAVIVTWFVTYIGRPFGSALEANTDRQACIG
jgi:hypothetical protein